MSQDKHTIFKCPSCGDIFDNEEELNKHLELHRIAEKRSRKELREPAILHGLEIKEGNVLRVGIGKVFYVVKVKGITDNPYIVLCEDVYGHEATINLAKAFLIQKLNKEDFERRREAIGGKKRKKRKKT